MAKLRSLLEHRFLVPHISASPLVPTPARWRVLQALGVDVGQSYLRPGLNLGSMVVNIDDGCGVLLDDDGTMGRNVGLDQGTRVLSGTHDVEGSDQRWGPPVERPVRIDARCWVGPGVRVLPRVTIGRACIVPAGAIVASDCAPNGVHVEIPARRVRDLPEHAPSGDG